MILFPQKYRVYWYVTDFYEEHYAVPVQVENMGRGMVPAFSVRLDFVGHTEYVYEAKQREIYRTQKQAAKVAAVLNKRYKELRQREDY